MVRIVLHLQGRGNEFCCFRAAVLSGKVGRWLRRSENACCFIGWQHETAPAALDGEGCDLILPLKKGGREQGELL